MKTFYIFLLLFYIYLTGCSSTVRIKNDQTAYESLNEKLTGERCQVLLADSGSMFAENITMGIDTTYMVKWSFSSLSGWDPVDTIRTSTSNIQRIHYTHNGMGALEGLGFGFAGGLVLAALTPGAAKDAAEEDPVGGVAAGMAMGAMALTTPIIGLITGALIGHKYECILNCSDSLAYGEVKKINLEELNDEDKSPVKVEFSSIVEKGSGYLVLLWQGKKIRLQRAEYYYRGTTEDNREYIVVQKYIYKLKFKN